MVSYSILYYNTVYYKYTVNCGASTQRKHPSSRDPAQSVQARLRPAKKVVCLLFMTAMFSILWLYGDYGKNGNYRGDRDYT